MVDAIKRDFFVGAWTHVLVRGIASLAFGVLAFVYPAITVAVLVMIFGIYTIIDGAVALWSAVKAGSAEQNRVWIGLWGVASIVAGLVCLLSPGLAAAYFVILIGLWYIFTGVMEIVSAVRLRAEIDNELWLGLAGAASVILGAAIIFYPAAGAISILWLIALSAVVVGILLILLALRLRGIGEKVAG